MQVVLVFLVVAVVVMPLLILYVFAWPGLYRRWIVRRPFAAGWRDILANRMPFYRKLTPALQLQLQDLIKVRTSTSESTLLVFSS